MNNELQISIPQSLKCHLVSVSAVPSRFCDINNLELYNIVYSIVAQLWQERICLITVSTHLQENHNQQSIYTHENLTATLSDMFLGGTDTIKTTMRFALLLLLKHPHVTGEIVCGKSKHSGRCWQDAASTLHGVFQKFQYLTCSSTGCNGEHNWGK